MELKTHNTPARVMPASNTGNGYQVMEKQKEKVEKLRG
jgi:hypothetical protein